MPDTELPVIRIAMWSGPRNISTALMRSWENRTDTAVVDEPFYACYLTATGIVHPMQEEVLASQSSNWQQVIDTELEKDLEPGQNIQYQKHMTQHMVAEINPEWFGTLKHAFLIRHPAEVVASYGQKRGTVTVADIGFAQQERLYQQALALSDTPPPIIDAKDVLTSPEATLTKLCERLGVPFDKKMLSWPAGRRDSDGAWAPHWYASVEKSTHFSEYKQRDLNLSGEQQRVVDTCLPCYESMFEQRLT